MRYIIQLHIFLAVIYLFIYRLEKGLLPYIHVVNTHTHTHTDKYTMHKCIHQANATHTGIESYVCRSLKNYPPFGKAS